MATLSDFYRRNALLYPSKPAFVYDDGTCISFADFNKRVNKFASGMASLGIRPHDRVAVFSGNCPEMVEAIGGAEKGAFVAVPISHRLTGREVSYIVNDCEARALIVQESLVGVVEPFIQDMATVRYFVVIGAGEYCRPWKTYAEICGYGTENDLGFNPQGHDLVYIFYTSGTTGRPKGVMLDHYGQVENAKAVITEFELRPHHRCLNTLPLNHIGGKGWTTSSFVRGCTNFIMRRFDAHAALRLIEQAQIQVLYAVPTILISLLEAISEQNYDLSSLTAVCYSGSPMSADKIREAMGRLGPRLIQVYGATEAGPTISVLRKEHHLEAVRGRPERLKSCGLPASFVDVRIVDDDGNEVAPGQVGEILVKSDHIMRGYWKNQEATEQTLRSGWLHTGDLGYFDEEHFIYIVGRKKDMIISGGENIYAAEVEQAIALHPAVAEVAVVGVPDEKWGEVVAAFIVRKPGTCVTAEEIIEHCKQYIGFKRPRIVEFWDSLPKSSLGKVLKGEILSRYLLSRSF